MVLPDHEQNATAFHPSTLLEFFTSASEIGQGTEWLRLCAPCLEEHTSRPRGHSNVAFSFWEV